MSGKFSAMSEEELVALHAALASAQSSALSRFDGDYVTKVNSFFNEAPARAQRQYLVIDCLLNDAVEAMGAFTTPKPYVTKAARTPLP